MNVSTGAALIIGAMLPPAMIKPPNTQPNTMTKPTILSTEVSGVEKGSPAAARAAHRTS